MPDLNPNHPVTQAMDAEFMHKLCGVLVMKLGGYAEITPDDIREFQGLFGREIPTLCTRVGATIELELMSSSQGMALARAEGGLPQ